MPWKLLNCITDISHISFNSAIWVELLKTRAYMDKSKAASSAATFNNHKTIVFTPLLNKRAMPWTTTPVEEDNFPAATLFSIVTNMYVSITCELWHSLGHSSCLFSSLPPHKRPLLIQRRPHTIDLQPQPTISCTCPTKWPRRRPASDRTLLALVTAGERWEVAWWECSPEFF